MSCTQPTRVQSQTKYSPLALPGVSLSTPGCGLNFPHTQNKQPAPKKQNKTGYLLAPFNRLWHLLLSKWTELGFKLVRKTMTIIICITHTNSQNQPSHHFHKAVIKFYLQLGSYPLGKKSHSGYKLSQESIYSISMESLLTVDITNIFTAFFSQTKF